MNGSLNVGVANLAFPPTIGAPQKIIFTRERVFCGELGLGPRGGGKRGEGNDRGWRSNRGDQEVLGGWGD